MALSRTARFLIAALLVAAAAFVWVNYFNQDPLAPTTAAQPGIDTSAPVALADNAGAESDVVTADDTVQGDAAGSGSAVDEAGGAASTVDEAGAAAPVGAQADTTDGAPVVAGDTPVDTSGSATPATTPAAAAPTVGSGDAPAVVVTESPTVVTRDLVVDVLPFLVTSPPQPGSGQVADEADGAGRPQLTQRSSINPFSPVVVQAPPAAPSSNVVAANEPPPADSPVIEVVDAPAAPPASQASSATPSTPVVADATPVAAPAPRAVTPSSTMATNLPRALPSGMLPSTPEILRDTRSQANLVTPVVPDLAAIAALKEPGSAQDDVELRAVAAAFPSGEVLTPDIIGVPQPQESAVASGSSLPLAVGADPLSRYLRDNDVRFTGTVLGPLSVGVFRSSLYGSPVVLTLGQPLPETDIILSDLRGYEARFSLGDRTQTLSLDLRR